MRALTLATPAIQAMNLDAPLRDLVAVEDGAVSLSTIGQRVTISPNHARAPQHVGVVFEIIRVVDGMGGDDKSRVWLKNAISGEEIGWYPAGELEPARAANENPIPPDRQQQEDTTMHANNVDDELIQLANTIARERGISLRDATIEAGRRLPALAERRRADIGAETTTNDTAQPPRPVINLRDGEAFFALCQRTAAERQIHLSQAIRMVSAAHPDLAEAYGRGEF